MEGDAYRKNMETILDSVYRDAFADAEKKSLFDHDEEPHRAGLRAVAVNIMRRAARIARSVPAEQHHTADDRSRLISDRLEHRANILQGRDGEKEPSDHPLTAEHAYVAGQVLGLALKHGLKLMPVVEDGNYTGRFEVLDPDLGAEPGTVRVFINVEPPVSETSTTDITKEN